MQPLPLPEGVPTDVEVYQLTLKVDAACSTDDWHVLRDEERAQAQRWCQHADRVRFIATRAALRRLLAAQLQTPATQLRFDRNPHGKPQLQTERSEGLPLHFNVSHAGAHALIAIGRRSLVGVDIECCNRAVSVTELEPYVLSPREQQADRALRLPFFDHWAAKEAALKAIGIGITEHLQHLSVLRPATTGEMGYRVHSDSVSWPALRVCRLEAPSGYAAALAWTEQRSEELS